MNILASRNNHASVPRSSDRTRGANYDPGRGKWRANDSLKCSSVWMAGVLFSFSFFSPPLLFFLPSRKIFVVDPFRATDLRNASIYAPSCHAVHPCFFYFSTMPIFLSLLHLFVYLFFFFWNSHFFFLFFFCVDALKRL